MSVPKINSLSVSEINGAFKQMLGHVESLVSKSKQGSTGLINVTQGPAGPQGKSAALDEYATEDLPELSSYAIAFDSTLSAPVYFHSGSWFKLKDDSLVKSFV